MILKNRNGMTLVEILISTALAGALMIALAYMFTSVNEMGGYLTSKIKTEEEYFIFKKYLKKWFARGSNVAIAPTGAAPGLGYLIDGTGKITITADLRRCDKYNPSARVESVIELSCCTCKNASGLQVKVTENNNKVSENRCIENIASMRVAQVGYNEKSSSKLYRIDLLSGLGSGPKAKQGIPGTGGPTFTFQTSLGASPLANLLDTASSGNLTIDPIVDCVN